MVTKKPKGLGRGLEALLGPKVEEKVEQAQAVQAGLPSALPLTELVPGVYQPRTRMDEGALYELAESIKAQGIMQPILVRRLVDGENAGKYEIIAGERLPRLSPGWAGGSACAGARGAQRGRCGHGADREHPA